MPLVPAPVSPCSVRLETDCLAPAGMLYEAVCWPLFCDAEAEPMLQRGICLCVSAWALLFLRLLGPKGLAQVPSAPKGSWATCIFNCFGFCKICMFAAIVKSLRKSDKKSTLSVSQKTMPAPWRTSESPGAEHPEACLGVVFCQLCDPYVTKLRTLTLGFQAHHTEML